MTTTPCRKSTSCKATIPRTKAALKSIRITADIQSNSQSIKRSPNSIKGQKSVNSPGLTPLRISKMCSKDSTGLFGSRCSMSTFQSLSMWQGQCRARKTATPAKKFVKLSSSFFSRRWAKRSLGIGNISISSLVEITSSRRHWWQSQSVIFAGLKRCFDQPKPFRQETCLRPTMHSKMSGSTCCFIKRTATSNLKSGKRLCDETLETVTALPRERRVTAG